MFKEKIKIYSNKSKEEAIAVLSANVESWRKDSSKLLFEGKVMPDGDFDINLGPVITGRRTRISVVRIKGGITRAGAAGSNFNVQFSVFKNMEILFYVAPILLLVISIFLYSRIIPIELPWFIPLVFIPVIVGSLYLTFTADVKKATQHLMLLIA